MDLTKPLWSKFMSSDPLEIDAETSRLPQERTAMKQELDPLPPPPAWKPKIFTDMQWSGFDYLPLSDLNWWIGM
jgi:hypothetical protein